MQADKYSVTDQSVRFWLGRITYPIEVLYLKHARELVCEFFHQLLISLEDMDI